MIGQISPFKSLMAKSLNFATPAQILSWLIEFCWFKLWKWHNFPTVVWILKLSEFPRLSESLNTLLWSYSWRINCRYMSNLFVCFLYWWVQHDIPFYRSFQYQWILRVLNGHSVEIQLKPWSVEWKYKMKGKKLKVKI